MSVDKWLTQYLREHGETAAKAVKADGETAGYSPRNMIRAMRSLGCNVRTEGRNTFWSLPSITDRAPAVTGDAQPDTSPTTSTEENPSTGPTCPTCGHRWPVRKFEEPMPWWCPYDGTRYSAGTAA
jgi:hypothetical protein